MCPSGRMTCWFLSRPEGESSEPSLGLDSAAGSPGEGAGRQRQHLLGQVQQGATLHCGPLRGQS